MITETPYTSQLGNMPNLYLDHRGWPGVFPEETLEAYRGSLAAGAQFVEVDVQSLSDGTLVCMHDTTIDRTTTGSGLVESQSGPSWSLLNVDAGTFLGGGWGNVRAPRFADIVSEFGNKYTLLVEIKDGKPSTAASVLELLQRLDISKEKVVVSSFTVSNLTAFIADGWTCSPLYGTYAGTPTPADIKATGAQWVGVGSGTSSAWLDALRSETLVTTVYTVNLVSEAAALSAHVDGVYTDEGAYLRGTARRTTDPFPTQTWYHGHIKGNSSGDGGGRGVFYTPNQWGFNLTTNVFASCLMGWANPIGGSTTCPQVTLDFSVKFETAVSTTRWASLAIMDSDKPYSSDASGSGLNGYHFLASKDGALTIYRIDSGAPALLQVKSVGATPIANGGSASYRITITPTTVKMERTDIALATSDIADATYRGAFLHANCKGAFAKFSGISISIP